MSSVTLSASQTKSLIKKSLENRENLSTIEKADNILQEKHECGSCQHTWLDNPRNDGYANICPNCSPTERTVQLEKDAVNLRAKMAELTRIILTHEDTEIKMSATIRAFMNALEDIRDSDVEDPDFWIQVAKAVAKQALMNGDLK